MLPLLRTLCSLRWQSALTALYARLVEAQQDAPTLLSELFAAPPEAEVAGVQLAAAQQAAALLEQRAAARSKKAPQGERRRLVQRSEDLGGGDANFVLPAFYPSRLLHLSC